MISRVTRPPARMHPELTMEKLPFQNADPARTSFQFLEDLSTAYWFSEVLFTGIRLGLFDFIQDKYPTTAELAGMSSSRVDELARLLAALEQMELIRQTGEGRWCNAQITSRYLTGQSDNYMGDLLLYRRYMQPAWQTLSNKVSQDSSDCQPSVEADQDHDRKTHDYVRAMDQLLAQKAKEIVRLVNPAVWQPPLLDVGGGAGSLGRALLRSKRENSSSAATPHFHADLLELKEVLAAARDIRGGPADWQGINTIAGDFRYYGSQKKYGLVVLSNFLHAYSRAEAKELLCKGISLLSPGGVLLVHDYFPDRFGPSLAKGPLYDLAMMLNTYNGRCHDSSEILAWLHGGGMAASGIRDLGTDSSVIVSVREKTRVPMFLPGRAEEADEWRYIAREEGFERGEIIQAAEIVTASWVRKKCQYGCDRYGKGLQCPPNGMDSRATREMIDAYSWGVLVEGMPPGRDFHAKLLALERRAFLSGYHRAFAFTAGHCPVCDECPEEGICRFPDKCRPSMEGSGIDVYETAARAGITLRPVQKKMQYVKYIGLLLLA